MILVVNDTFGKIGGSIRVYDGTGYLLLFGPEKYDANHNKISYFIKQIKVLHMLLFIIL